MFPLRAFSKKIQRSVKKEKKWYFYQWNFDQENDAARFENYMAVQLSLACSYWTQQGYGKYELYYLRDQDRREVDFVITKDLRPLCLVEAKLSDTQIPSALKYYCNKLNVPGFLLYPEGPTTRFDYGYKTTSSNFLKGLICNEL
jgi:predicted AAA+ superfamily ATPase